MTQFQNVMPWVMMAPFGWPVVPDVYMMVETSSSVTGTTGKPGGRRKKKNRGSTAVTKEEPTTWLGRLKQRWAEKWAKLLEEAQKKK